MTIATLLFVYDLLLLMFTLRMFSVFWRQENMQMLRIYALLGFLVVLVIQEHCSILLFAWGLYPLKEGLGFWGFVWALFDWDEALLFCGIWGALLLAVVIYHLPPLVVETEAMARARRPWEFAG